LDFNGSRWPSYAFFIKNESSKKLFNLQTDGLIAVPDLQNAFYTQDGSALLGILKSPNGSAQIVSVNLKNGQTRG
jgi:hypothetical protein